MPTPITLPDLGAGGEQIHVSCWLVDPGDVVDAGDRVVEVIIPGITFDVPAPVAGTLVKIEKSLDMPVAPGDILGWIEEHPGERPA